MRADVPRDIFDVTKLVADEYGIQKLAQQMGINIGTLYNKLSSHLNESSHHKLAVQDFIQIMSITGDKRLVQCICRMANGAFFSLPQLDQVSDSALLDILTRLHAEEGDVNRALNLALQDGKITQGDYSLLSKEIIEVHGALAELDSRLEAMIVD